MLVGNKGVLSSVNTMLKTGRLPHAVIIEGEEGLGKRTLAGYIAAGAVCEGEEKPCHTCKNCHLAEIGTHPDVSFYPADGKYTVDAVRSIRQEAYLVPHMAKRRVFIFTAADTLSPACQNALLKVIEEPPAYAMMIFLLPSAQSLLETVRSRCITFSLAPPERGEAAKYIASKVNAPLGEIYSALDICGGNIGRALSALGDKNSGTLEADSQTLLKFALCGDSYGILKLLYGYDKDRKAVAELVSAIKLKICDNIKNDGTPASREKLVGLYDALLALEESLQYNCNLRLFFSNLCLALVKGLK